MALTVKYGSELTEDMLRQIYQLDVLVYDEELRGEFENLRRRYEFNRDTFVCAMDGDRVVGYINFFPVGEALHNELFDTNCTVIRDDDIRPEELEQYSQDKPNNIFIISVVVHPEYRDGEAVKLISNNFVSFLSDMHRNGCTIGDISGAAVSVGGRRFMSRMGFEAVKPLDDGYELYVCEKEKLEELLK